MIDRNGLRCGHIVSNRTGFLEINGKTTGETRRVGKIDEVIRSAVCGDGFGQHCNGSRSARAVTGFPVVAV